MIGEAGVAITQLAPEGKVQVHGEYWNAVHRYLSTGDASRLVNFRGKHITDAQGEKFPLLTDREELDRLGSAGVLSFESLYARVA